MKRFEMRTFLGAGLVLLGGLMLIEKIGWLKGFSHLFGGAILLMAASYFLYVFVQSPKERWWAIIPAMALLGMAGSALLPDSFSKLGGGFFLSALGLAFFIVYITDRSRWWGIIPGGVLLTLGLVAGLEGNTWGDTGSLFFLGLGLTFLLVAVLPNPVGKMQWAYIPALVLALMGGLLGTQSSAGLADYVLPAGLILAGLVVLVTFFLRKE
jgi:hypothetical protein